MFAPLFCPGMLPEMQQAEGALIVPPVHFWQTSLNRLQYGRVLAAKYIHSNLGGTRNDEAEFPIRNFDPGYTSFCRDSIRPNRSRNPWRRGRRRWPAGIGCR